MKKINFKIRGMHCKSCESLIESNLNDHLGIENASINFDSAIGKVVYDEQKIKWPDILKIIEESGDYKAEKIEDNEKKNIEKDSFSRSEEIENPSHSNISIPISIIIVGLIIGGAIFINGSGDSSKKNIPTGQTAQVLPNSGLPSGQPSAIQTFEITKSNHIRGDFNAPVTLVEFSDFQCPFCGRHEPTLNKILNDYPKQVRLVYKHFPLPFHQYGQKAAEASECADEQGKFWEYHDKLFENQSDFSIDNFKKWAADLKLNTGQFNSCLDSGKYTNKVQADYQEGAQKGVNGTPATFINGQMISGALPYGSFQQVIDSILKK